METKQSSKRVRKPVKTATAKVIEEMASPVGEDKETALRSGITVNALSLARAAVETKDELAASVRRAETVMILLTQGKPDDVKDALRSSAKSDGNKYALDVPKVVNGKQAYGENGQPITQKLPQPPIVYHMVTRFGMQLQSARVRVREIRALRDALASGLPFEWKKEKGWHAIVRLADKVNKQKADQDRRNSANLRVQELFLKMREEEGIPQFVQKEGKQVLHVPSEQEAEKLEELYVVAQREVEAELAATTTTGETEEQRVQRIGQRMLKDRGYDVAMKVAKWIIANAKPEPEQGEPSAQVKEAVAGAIVGRGRKAKAAKVAVH